MPFVKFFVPGHPKPQPRPRAFSHKGHARVYDAGTAEGWKGTVAIMAAGKRPPNDHFGEVTIYLAFKMARPKSHFRIGKNNGKLKASAPWRHLSKPDIDNLVKAVLDALTLLGFWKDDSQITTLVASKRYATTTAGVEIAIDLLD